MDLPSALDAVTVSIHRPVVRSTGVANDPSFAGWTVTDAGVGGGDAVADGRGLASFAGGVTGVTGLTGAAGPGERALATTVGALVVTPWTGMAPLPKVAPSAG